MSNADTADRASDKADGRDRFAAHIGNEDFAFREVIFNDRKVTGAQIAEAAGAHPVENFVVLLQLDNFELETLRPVELVDLSKAARFFVIEGDGTEKFLVDGLSLEWPKKVVTGLTIKRIVGKNNDEIELIQELEQTPDQVVEDEDEVRIGRRGVEKFKTRPAKVDVKIIVNGREKEWKKKKISFDEVVKLAYPTPPAGQCIVYTVTYHNGPRHHPEGTLTENHKVKVKDGMVFNVQYTDKS